MSNAQVAFFIGLFGSIHCIGMCGPLAFAVPFTGNSNLLLVWDKLIYQAGRVISYGVLGLIAGLIGKQLWMAGLQQGISIASGVLIIMAAASRLFKWRMAVSRLDVFAPFNRLLGYALKNRMGHLFIGMLNGLLPCGFVYLALVGAINTGSVTSSAFFMLWFGAGTVPLMLAATLGAGLLTPLVRTRISRAMPYFMLFLGVWFILRGLALDIPYISPAKSADTAICH
ncbi:sulfite exporter TauE/SafE family protein [Mucilaginibacter limnophilus]|uniref:Sulfite exporter TauE/SafE family protein n=1 Tax=Mucilaginibacter limnophilus TaxID=1932778 RepID=A0A3S3TK29_9SPHI|nr:sulfite exporter TauE/SafE family protein [Mucilaginibacter limnophilus]RVU02847.1 sulfite exporter TauE/SafE family protein [Mucilaginibacter limnophilus]